MFRNEEFKSIIIKLLIFQILFALIGFISVNIYMNRINENIVETNMALMGSLIRDNPDIADKIVPYITKEVSRENIELGREALKDYGYTRDLKKSLQPALRNITPNVQIAVFLLILLFTLPLGYMIKQEYEIIYEKIQEVYTLTERVVEGDFSLYLKEEGEGDFNILNHQVNQMSTRLKNSLDILKKEKEFLKDMISDISHQLKTPLSSLIILNELILEDKDMDLETRIKFINKANNQIERMEWLTINLLKVARIEAGAIEFKKERVYLKDVVDIALGTLSYKLEDQSIHIQGNLESAFYGDRDWSGEALINIIKNSIEHGGGKIEIILEQTPLFSNIIVRDNGEGIEDKDLPHIFDRFYKANSAVKPQSIGIGLNLARLIVESQEGTISVKSKKDLGTEMRITFLNPAI